jgi:excinuclease ABC subunit C
MKAMPSTLDRSHIPHACGVYIMRDAAGGILYIGKAKDLAKRVAHYFNPEKPDVKNTVLAPLIRSIDYIACASERESLLLERRLIFKHRPFFNAMWKDNKSYPYVKLTMGEDFPRLTLTRRKVNDGGLYFGPYPKVAPMRTLLNYLWRHKFFLLRPCRWDFSEAKPLDPKKISGCLYFHTEECPAPSAGKVAKQEYRKQAEEAALFFKGDFAALKEAFETEMKEASRSLQYEKAARLRDNLAAISQMGERVRVAAVTEADIDRPVSDSRAVTDLQAALGLAAPPFHVECFDISHFQGRQTVASMVCFKGGRPNKDHYRRFKIREVAGIDDFRSMEEVVARRYRRLAEAGEPLPDLVLIDGGKGQLASAQRALRKIKVKVPLASLAKRLEEVFIPGKADSILLERGRPALNLLQQLRDEAHRFGVKYHRLLRGKALFTGAS